AVPRALDAHLVAIGLLVKMRRYRNALAADRLFQRFGGGLGGIAARKVDLHAAQDCAERLAVDQPRYAVDHRLGEQIGLRQLRERVAGDGLGARARNERRFDERLPEHELVQLVLVLEIALFSSELRFIERRLRDVDVTALDELRHLPVEEGEQERADVRAVDVRIGHDDDAVVAQLVGVVFLLAEAAAERGDERGDLGGGKQLVEARALDIEDLALERQDRLELAVASLLGRAARGIALDEIKLAQRRVALLAVGELAGQAHAVQHALAAGHFARPARRLARCRRLDDLHGNGARIDRMLIEKLAQLLRDYFFDHRPHLRGDQLLLRLR